MSYKLPTNVYTYCPCCWNTIYICHTKDVKSLTYFKCCVCGSEFTVTGLTNDYKIVCEEYEE